MQLALFLLTFFLVPNSWSALHELKVSQVYLWDLGKGIQKERVVVSKSAQYDQIEVQDFYRKPLFNFALSSHGKNSGPTKMIKKNLGKNLRLMIIHHHEGQIKRFGTDGRIRAYFLVYSEDLRFWNMTKGPVIFWESRKEHFQYFQRPSSIELKDLDGNHFKEVIVHSRETVRVYKLNHLSKKLVELDRPLSRPF